MGELREIRMHELATFRRCPKKYEYAFVRNWEPLVPPEVVRIGDYVHQFLAHAVAPDARPQPVPRREDEDAFAMAEDIVTRYVQHVGLPPAGDVIAVEEDYSREISELGVTVAFKPDLVYWDEARTRFVIRDYKTVDQIPRERTEDELDLQPLVYLWGMRPYLKLMAMLIGRRPGTCSILWEYEFLRRAVPRDPDVTRDGRVSRARITTTRERYEAAVRRAGADPAEYADILDSLPREADYFGRERILLTPEELDRAESEILDSLRLLLLADRHDLFPRNPIKTGGERCAGCPYFQLCKAELLLGREENEQAIRAMGYKKRGVDEEEVTADEAASAFD